MALNMGAACASWVEKRMTARQQNNVSWIRPVKAACVCFLWKHGGRQQNLQHFLSPSQHSTISIYVVFTCESHSKGEFGYGVGDKTNLNFQGCFILTIEKE